MSRYERTSSIRSERMDSDGIIEGTLATNGEASDGHIIDLNGMRLNDGAPLLFNHDATTGRNNLGSWITLQTMGSPRGMQELGDQQLHGTAQIEVHKGEGEQLALRRDTAAMISAGHINSFSVRWGPGNSDPVGRRALPKDHPAHSTADTAGLYFPDSVMLEGSVVTIGADSAAVMRHIHGLTERDAWLKAIGADELERMIDAFEAERTERVRFERVDAFFDGLDEVPTQLVETVPKALLDTILRNRDEIVPGDVQPDQDVVEESSPSLPDAATSARIIADRLEAHEAELTAKLEKMAHKFVG